MDCEFTDCVAVTAISVNSREMSLWGCRFHDCNVDPITISSGRLTMSDCLFDNIQPGLTLNAVTVSGSALLEATRCTVYSVGANGFDLGSTPMRAVIVNCCFESCVGFAVNVPVVMDSVRMQNCAFFGNGGKYQASNVSPRNILGEVTPAATAFVNAAGRNFALNNTAGAGALLRAAGYPSILAGAATTSYSDIGVAQHQDSGGGASGLRKLGMDGGFSS